MNKYILLPLFALFLVSCAGVGNFTTSSGSTSNIGDRSKVKLDTIAPLGEIDIALEDQLIGKFKDDLAKELEKKGYTIVESGEDMKISGKVVEIKLGSSGGRVAAEIFFGAIGRKMAAAKFRTLMTVQDSSGKVLLEGESFGNHEVGGTGVESEIMEATGRSASAFSKKFASRAKTQN